MSIRSRRRRSVRQPIVRQVIVACCLIAGCRSRARGGQASATMPGFAPESTPIAIERELRRPANILVDPPGISGRVVKNALYVRFTDAASEGERVAALRAVGGVVVGGLRMSDGELYHVRIDVPADSGAGPLLRARETLRALPQVKLVLLDVLGALP